MCFSVDASLGVAGFLLPVGGYCVAAAWHKDRSFLPLAATPFLFGLQQLGEATVWVGLERADPDLVRRGSRWFLFFALALWPVWIPASLAVTEGPGPRRRVSLALVVLGLGLAGASYPAMAADGLWESARIAGHSIRYDFSDIPIVRAAPGWVWPTAYVATVCVPFLAARDHRLWPLGAAVAFSAAVTYVAFREVFASVWCFLAAVLSAYLVFILWSQTPRVSDDSRTPSPVPDL